MALLAALSICAALHTPIVYAKAQPHTAFFLIPGEDAVAYFERRFPDMAAAEQDGRGNSAEWLLSITTKAHCLYLLHAFRGLHSADLHCLPLTCFLKCAETPAC
jgi:hypothetical protein